MNPYGRYCAQSGRRKVTSGPVSSPPLIGGSQFVGKVSGTPVEPGRSLCESRTPRPGYSNDRPIICDFRLQVKETRRRTRLRTGMRELATDPPRISNVATDWAARGLAPRFPQQPGRHRLGERPGGSAVGNDFGAKAWGPRPPGGARSGHLTLRAAGELDIDSAALVEQTLLRAFEGGAGSIVLDLTAVSFIDAAGLRLLMWAAECSREDSGRLRMECIRRGSPPARCSATRSVVARTWAWPRPLTTSCEPR